MGITRKIIDWCDDKMDEAYVEDNAIKAAGKAFGSGFVEGLCDAAIILYVPLVVSCYLWRKAYEDK